MKAVAAAALLFCAASAHAINEGETGFQFLTVPTAARAVALGNAFTGMRGDITVIDYNPGGLIGFDRLDINVGHQSYFEESSLNSVAVGYPFAIRHFPKTVVAVQYKEFKAEDDARDTSGIPIGEITLHDQMIQAAAGFEMGPWGVGGSWKYIKNKIEDEDRKNSAFDAGVTYEPGGPFHLGASVLNVGSSKAFVEDKDPLPSLIRIGAVYEWKRVNFLSDVVQTRDKQTQPSLGAELSLNRYVTFRFGGRYATSFEPSGGIGFTLADIGGPPKSAPPPPQPKKKAEPTSKRRTLGRSGESSSLDVAGDNRSILLGLDYAIRHNETLGAVHSLTLKILY